MCLRAFSQPPIRRGDYDPQAASGLASLSRLSGGGVNSLHHLSPRWSLSRLSGGGEIVIVSKNYSISLSRLSGGGDLYARLVRSGKSLSRLSGGGGVVFRWFEFSQNCLCRSVLSAAYPAGGATFQSLPRPWHLSAAYPAGGGFFFQRKRKCFSPLMPSLHIHHIFKEHR